jgi:hypothetical protein
MAYLIAAPGQHIRRTQGLGLVSPTSTLLVGVGLAALAVWFVVRQPTGKLVGNQARSRTRSKEAALNQVRAAWGELLELEFSPLRADQEELAEMDASIAEQEEVAREMGASAQEIRQAKTSRRSQPR